MEQENIVRVHAIVDGRVQGVGFRYFVLDRAQYLNLTGWVRNTYDGKVEVVAEGSRTKLDQLIMHLRQGPPSAFVSGVITDWQAASSEFQWFDVKPTA